MFVIILRSSVARLSVAEVESSSFTLCRVIRCLVTLDVQLMPFDEIKTTLLNMTPTWCYYGDSRLAQALNELPRPVFLVAVCQIQPDKGVFRHCKAHNS
jgi:hypothetical protein